MILPYRGYLKTYIIYDYLPTFTWYAKSIGSNFL